MQNISGASSIDLIMELKTTHGHTTSIFGKYLFGRRFALRSKIFGTCVVSFLLACLS